MTLSSFGQLDRRRRELVEQRRRFVCATVVRAQCPTSTRPGDAAVVLPDGTIEGFVGGQCAEESVRSEALSVLERGESLLLRILPADSDEFPDTPGAKTVVNPCLSGGSLEIFLEPKIPAPMVAVVGLTPIAEALARQAATLGLDATSVEPAEEFDAVLFSGATAVIIASHGRGEESAIRCALDAGVGFVGLVASRTRAKAVLGSLDLDHEDSERVHSPVGLEIGARTAEEIALSIMAAVVRAIRTDDLVAPATDLVERPASAVDPVCGMSVTVVADTPTWRHDGSTYWFCNPGCLARFRDDMGAR